MCGLVAASADLDEDLRRERRARALLQSVAVAAARSRDLEETLRALVREVCLATGWPVGHVLRVGADGALESSRLWHLDDAERYELFRAVSETSRFHRGVGLPGRVLESGKAHWIMDVLHDDNFPRAEPARDLGIHAAFAFPVLALGQVALVLEFASPETVPPDLPLLEVMEAIATQLGWILERSRAEDALRESELRFRKLTETANDAIITADAQGNIVSWNGCAERMFGRARDAILGRPLLEIIPERFREAHEAGMQRVRSGGERRVIGKTVELAGLRADGSEFPLELSLASWQLGERTFFSGILRDITDRKLADDRLRSVAAQLERSERAAVDASKAKSLFLANMSHELRTPLNAILGFVQILDRDRGLGPEQREHLSIISRAGEHLLGLINDVLSVAKIEAGETELHPVDFELPRLLTGIREMFHLRAQARGLSLVFDHGSELPARVHGDEGKLRQVLINLLGNAVKFTEHGGVALRARYSEGRAAFEIEDTGPGIAADDLARLFEPFVQAASGKRAAEGTGLGLSISRDFVRMMGGELGVKSELGAGTRFAFEVPLPQARTSAPPQRLPPVLGLEPDQPAQRILVVDNSHDNRRLLSHLLRAVGFDVREAIDGKEAVDVWRAWQPTFVWMDMRMPVMDGYEATRRIRALEAARPEPGSRTVVVALTASAFEHDRASILAAGCDEIVPKPFREDAVFDTMARHLGLRYSRAEASAELGAGPGVTVTAERLGALPSAIREDLVRALSQGDDLGAQRAVDKVDSHDPALAEALRHLVRGFRFDELLGVLERV
jgi:two-component system sensor histidine kinase/response regulator